VEGTAASKIVAELLAFSATIDKMRKFVMLNTLAVIKITKKHDKQSQQLLQYEMVNSVHKRHFYNSGRFSSLIIDSEVLTAQVRAHTPSVVLSVMRMMGLEALRPAAGNTVG